MIKLRHKHNVYKLLLLTLTTLTASLAQQSFSRITGDLCIIAQPISAQQADVTMTSYVPAEVQCAWQCTQMTSPRCVSFNYRSDVITCELFSAWAAECQLQEVAYCVAYQQTPKPANYCSTVPNTDICSKILVQMNFYGFAGFNKTWSDYVTGFSNPPPLPAQSGPVFYWIGLDTLHYLTRDNAFKLDVTLRDYSYNSYVVSFNTFWIENSTTAYTLHVANMTGNVTSGGLLYCDGCQFATPDREPTYFCPRLRTGGFWFKQTSQNCSTTNLNSYVYTNFAWGADGKLVCLPPSTKCSPAPSQPLTYSDMWLSCK